MIAARTHVNHVGCTLMVFHSSAKVVENDGTREMDRVFSPTNLEMKQINDWLNLERARSSSARV